MIGTLRTVVLDAPDVRRLAAFYTALGGWAEQYADDEWITMETGDGWRIAAQRSPDHVPPRWPDPAYPQQAHLDLRVPDLDACRPRRSSWAPSCCARTRTGTRWPTRPGTRSTCACSRRSRRPR